MSSEPKGRIAVDMQHLPLVVVTFPSEPVSDAEVERFIAGQRDLLRRGVRVASVADARYAKPITPRQRKMLGDWIAESERYGNVLTIAMGIVVENALVRGAVTAVLWLKQPACPTKVFATVPEAIDFAIAELRRAGVPGVEKAVDHLASLGGGARRASR